MAVMLGIPVGLMFSDGRWISASVILVLWVFIEYADHRMAHIKHAETRKFAEDYLASREALIVSLTEKLGNWLEELRLLREDVHSLRGRSLEEAAQLLDEEADKGDKLWDDYIASKRKGPATSYAVIPRKYAEMIRELKDK